MTTTTYTCPKGHQVESDTAPECHRCKIIGTHYNPRTAEVFEWTKMAEYRRNCEQLQDAMDAAFDNQYFGGGW